MASTPQPQPPPPSPAQLGDAQALGRSTAVPNTSLDPQAGLSGVAQPALTDQGAQAPQAHQNDAAAENGQPDPTPQHDAPQHDAPQHHAISSGEMDTADNNGVQTLSEEELASIAEKWLSKGKPKCPDCNKAHPPPCNPERIAHLARVQTLRDSDPEAYKTQMAAFQAKYPRKASKQEQTAAPASNPAQSTSAPKSKRKADSEDAEMLDTDAPAVKKGKTEQRKKYSRGLTFPPCKSCQECHPFGQHTKTKDEAQRLATLQYQGLAPRPDLAAAQHARDKAQDFKIANLRRGQFTQEELFARCDRRREEQANREQALIAQATSMFSSLVHQNPQAGLNYMAGMYHGNMAPISSFPRYDTPAYQHPAQSQNPAPTYGAPAPTFGAPAPTYPASAFPGAQHYAPQAAQTQDNAPQPPMLYSGTAYGVPPGTRYDATPSQVPHPVSKAPASTRQDPTEQRPARNLKDRTRRPDNNNNNKARSSGQPTKNGSTTQKKESFKNGQKFAIKSNGPLPPQPNGVKDLLPAPTSHREEASEEEVV